MTPPADAAALLRANRHGILCMCVAMACFVANDSLVKYASQSMASAQLVFIRGVMASILVLALARSTRALHQAGEMVRGTVAARAWIDAVATFTYLLALFHLPLVNATAIMMTAPLFIALIAAKLMRERVGPGRWCAIAAGFVGVLLVIQPRAEGFNAWSLVCLGGTVLMAVRDVMTRRIAPGVPSSIVTLATAIAVTLLSGAVSVVEGWAPFGAFEGALLGFAALFLAGGYYFIVAGMRYGELSVIGPFRYSGLLWAVIIGFLVWGEVPNALGWLGIALVTLSGLYVVYGERRRARVVDAPGHDA